MSEDLILSQPYHSMFLGHKKRYAEFHHPSAFLGLNLASSYYFLRSKLDARIRAHRLSLAGLNALSLLAYGEGLPLNKLSQLMLVSRADISRLAAGLERKGLIHRFQPREDRRVCIAKLTPAGRRWLDSYLPGHFKELKRLLSALTPAQMATMSSWLVRLRGR